jgi:hypothetical protein
MMTWKRIIRGEEGALCDVLTDEHGIFIGYVQRFFDDGPSYAWAHGNRLGAYTTHQVAKAAVEAAHL